MEKILIIKIQAIGDALMATPAIRALSKSFPEYEIDVLIGKWSAPVLRNNPYISKSIEVDEAMLFKKRLLPLLSLIRKIRKTKYEKVFVLHPSPFIHLLAFLFGIKKRYGLAQKKRGWFLTHSIDEIRSNDYYYPKNFLKTLNLSGVEAEDTTLDLYYTDTDVQRVNELFKKEDLSKGYIVIAPGGARNPQEVIKPKMWSLKQARLWQLKNYCRLSEILEDRFPDLKVVLVGSGSEIETNREIATSSASIINFTAKTSLQELAYLINQARAVICNDSAALHISISQNTPVVSLFGPTSLKSRVPSNLTGFSIQSEAECSPCYVHGKLPPCQHGYLCMERITPEHVAESIQKVLKDNP